jgi:hypothetical protein
MAKKAESNENIMMYEILKGLRSIEPFYVLGVVLIGLVGNSISLHFFFTNKFE